MRRSLTVLDWIDVAIVAGWIVLALTGAIALGGCSVNTADTPAVSLRGGPAAGGAAEYQADSWYLKTAGDAHIGQLDELGIDLQTTGALNLAGLAVPTSGDLRLLTGGNNDVSASDVEIERSPDGAVRVTVGSVSTTSSTVIAAQAQTWRELVSAQTALSADEREALVSVGTAALEAGASLADVIVGLLPGAP